tara:strand:+ start:180 stop:2045 length:1866 start_codon:yes stop_codon:yes gene_type:complete
MNKFILFFIFFSLTSLTCIASFNIYFEKLLFNDYFNKKINITTENRRNLSPVIIRHFKPECVLIGTSRIGRGMSNENKFLNQNKCFNLYLNAANINELNLILEKLIKNDVKQIILGLDFFSFNKNYSIKRYQGNFNKYEYSYDNFFIILLSNFSKFISIRTTKNNILNIYNQGIKKERLQTYDQIFIDTYDVTINKRQDVSLIDDRFSKAKSTLGYIDDKQKGHGIGNYKLNLKGLEEFKKLILKLNKSNNIDIKIFITPIHLYLLEAIYKSNLDDMYYNIIREVSKVTNNKNSKLYDFSGYNNITSGLSADKNFVSGNYFDTDHYSSEIGEVILIEIFKNNNMSKYLVSNKNFVEYKNSKLQERKEWLNNNILDNNILKQIFYCESNKCLEDIIFKSFSINYSYHTHTNNKNLEDEIFILGGEYNYGYQPKLRTIFDDEQKKIQLDPFFIDKTEVSYLDYDKNKYKNSKLKNHPVVNITYFQAKKFCKSVGKKLPTIYQWEIAARGQKEIRYSWGNKFPNCNLTTYNGEFSFGCLGSKDSNLDGTFTKQVDSNNYGESENGVLNLIGNVYEFVNSDNLDDAIAKGGGWSSENIRTNIHHNYYISKDIGYKNIGFRCVRNF